MYTCIYIYTYFKKMQRNSELFKGTKPTWFWAACCWGLVPLNVVGLHVGRELREIQRESEKLRTVQWEAERLWKRLRTFSDTQRVTSKFTKCRKLWIWMRFMAQRWFHTWRRKGPRRNLPPLPAFIATQVTGSGQSRSDAAGSFRGEFTNSCGAKRSKGKGGLGWNPVGVVNWSADDGGRGEGQKLEKPIGF